MYKNTVLVHKGGYRDTIRFYYNGPYKFIEKKRWKLAFEDPSKVSLKVDQKMAGFGL